MICLVFARRRKYMFLTFPLFDPVFFWSVLLSTMWCLLFVFAVSESGRRKWTDIAKRYEFEIGHFTLFLHESMRTLTQTHRCVNSRISRLSWEQP